MSSTFTARKLLQDVSAQQLTPCSRVLEKLVVTQLVEKLLAFMEPEGSLPCSQEPVPGSYPETDASISRPHNLLQ
jgi:hypothetical protein